MAIKLGEEEVAGNRTKVIPDR